MGSISSRGKEISLKDCFNLSVSKKPIEIFMQNTLQTVGILMNIHVKTFLYLQLIENITLNNSFIILYLSTSCWDVWFKETTSCSTRLPVNPLRLQRYKMLFVNILFLYLQK